MSPDPSVHKEQLDEMKRHWGSAGGPRKRKRGCLWVFAALAVLCVGTVLYVERDLFFKKEDKFEFGDLGRRLKERSEALRDVSAEDLMKRLRSTTEDIQKKWDDLAGSETGEMRERLEALREDLIKKRDSGSRALRKNWDAVVKKSEELIGKAKVKSKEVPGGLKELMGMLRKLDEAEKKTNRLLHEDERGAQDPNKSGDGTKNEE